MQATGTYPLILDPRSKQEISDDEPNEGRTLERRSDLPKRDAEATSESSRRQDGTASPPAGSGGPPDDDEPDSPENGTEAALPSSGELLMAQLEGETRSDRRRLRITLVVAMIFHLALLFFTLPDLGREPQFVGKPGKVYVMKQVRFQKPPAQAKQEQKIPDPKRKKIPIPDPTPDEPEPLRIEEFDIPDIEPTDADEVFFGIPEGPDPGFGDTGDFSGDAYQVGDGIQAPVGIHQPQPRYTEEARQARVQGVVILTAVIDETGEVRNLKAIKGLGLGLTESALKTVSEWKYEPAVDADGRPVPVFYNITIGFWLQ